MDSNDNSISLLERYRDGDNEAAQQIFNRYVDRLLQLARKRLSPKLQAKLDPDDIVQSAYRSFFAAAREGHFDVSKSGDLWRLLAAITINKLLKKVEYWGAAKRSPARELPQPQRNSTAGSLVHDDHQPGPEEVVLIADEVEHLMQGLNPLQRRVFELRLQGHTVKEIAVIISRSEFSTRRALNTIRAALRLRFEETTADDSAVR